MATRLPAAHRTLLAGVALIGALALLVRTGAISHTLFQAGFSILVLSAAGLVFLSGARRRSNRRGWLTLGVAMSLGMSANALAGWQELGVTVPEAVGVALGAVAFTLSVTGLAFMLIDRPSRLPLAAALDGMTGALVAQAVIAALLLEPVSDALRSQFDVVALVYPLGDVLLMGLVAAAVAHGGWRPDLWLVSLAGLVAMTTGDSAFLATTAAGAHLHGGIADFGWLVGAWLLAVAAWSPDPQRVPDRWVRSAVPVILAGLALAILLLSALRPEPLLPALGCAAGALSVVIFRLAITLNDNASMLLHARHEAVTDALTGLGNRRQLMADLQDALEHATLQAPAALALFDLNGFKDYNDTYGHPAGDALLASLGSQLAEAVAGSGTAYRMGGDEFCVLAFPGVQDHEAVTERAVASLSAGMGGFTVTAAHGVVLLPLEATNASDALRRADLRMYEQKAAGRIGSRRQVTDSLMVAVAERDGRLYGHGTEVEELAVRVARELGLSDSEVEAVRLGALTHDVGKLAIPDKILAKPEPLDDAEWDFMRRHTIIGQRILEGAPALRDVALLVRSSHERFDGAGYPDGLAGPDIPIGARIIAVCDAFAAMTQPRAYRDGSSPEVAMLELHRCAGTQFDPLVVATFEAILHTPADRGDALAA
jgi:two-component system cell cycle response regulator